MPELMTNEAVKNDFNWPPIKYSDGYHYQLRYPYLIWTGITGYTVDTDWIQLDEEGCMRFRVGYAWNGASGAIDDKVNKWASLPHDAGYQCIRLGRLPMDTRILWDKLFYAMHRHAALRVPRPETRIGWLSPRRHLWAARRAALLFRGKYHYRAVRLAKFAAEPENKVPVLTAPWGICEV